MRNDCEVELSIRKPAIAKASGNKNGNFFI